MARITLMLKKQPVLIAIALYIAGIIPLIAATSWMTELIAERLQQVAKDEALEKLLLAKSRLEASLFRDVFLADSLATIFSIDPEEASENFYDISYRLTEKSQNVRNVGIAPNDIIEKIYPVAGNERAIGLDFRTVPSQYETIQAARETKDVLLAGPLALVQGGRALIARLPIFNDFPRSQDYWGSISVVIDYDRLMASAGFFDINNAQIALRGINATGKDGLIFEGAPQTFAQADYQGAVVVPNGRWWVAAKFDTALSKQQLVLLEIGRWSILLIYTLLFAGFYMLWHSYRAQQWMANQDALTHLVNRRFALSYLERITSKSTKNHQFCVLAIDLNGFKKVNDLYGHDAGDAMLKLVAQGLEESVRGSDVVARMGGDEFLIILNRVKDEDTVLTMMKSIKISVETKGLPVLDSVVHPSLSIGYACSSSSITTPTDLLSLADQRMYVDKKKQAAERVNSGKS